jgi:hypothetical protein
MRGYIFLVDGNSGDQSGALEKAFQLRRCLLILVMAGPAFMPINIFSAVRPTFRDFEVVVGPVGALQIIARGGYW